jgi:hypothetical protein
MTEPKQDTPTPAYHSTNAEPGFDAVAAWAANKQPADDPLGPATWDVDDDAPLPDDDDAAGCPDPATLPDVCGLCGGDGVVRVPDESTVFPVVATCACVAIEDDDQLPFDR